MKKLFSHTNLVIIFATISLFLAISQFLQPKIEDYNDYVEEQQRNLKVEANGFDDEGYFIAHPFSNGANPVYYAQIAFFLGLSIILFKTKKFAFSFFNLLLFVLNFTVAYQLFLAFVKFPMSYFYNIPVYAPISVIVIMILSFWQSHFIFRYFQNALSKKLE